MPFEVGEFFLADSTVAQCISVGPASAKFDSAVHATYIGDEQGFILIKVENPNSNTKTVLATHASEINANISSASDSYNFEYEA